MRNARNFGVVVLLFAVGLLLAACSPVAPAGPTAEDIAAESRKLTDYLNAEFEEELAMNPLMLTQMGRKELYDQLGEEIYCEALRHIVEAWEGRPDSFRAAVLRGVMYFVQLYHGQYSAERLVRALSGVHPMELYRISRDNPAKLPGWRRYVYPIYTTYNGKCRKDALPMKF